MCLISEIYINETRVCDGVPDCSLLPWSTLNTTEDENLYVCPEEMRTLQNVFQKGTFHFLKL